MKIKNKIICIASAIAIAMTGMTAFALTESPLSLSGGGGNVENVEQSVELMAASSDTYSLSISGLEETYYYTGKEITPDITVAINGSDIYYDWYLDEDCYNIYYENNVEIGTATVTVEYINGSYVSSSSWDEVFTDLTATATFEIIERTPAASGQCGSNAYWYYYDDGTLEITGTGSMYDYDTNMTLSPFSVYLENIKTIIIEDGITSIGSYAFYDIDVYIDEPSISVIIPISITVINDYAFNNDGWNFYNSNVYYYGTEDGWNNIIIGDYNIGLTYATIHYLGPSTVTGDCGDSLEWELDTDTGALTITGTGDMWDYKPRS